MKSTIKIIALSVMTLACLTSLGHAEVTRICGEAVDAGSIRYTVNNVGGHPSNLAPFLVSEYMTDRGTHRSTTCVVDNYRFVIIKEINRPASDPTAYVVQAYYVQQDAAVVDQFLSGVLPRKECASVTTSTRPAPTPRPLTGSSAPRTSGCKSSSPAGDLWCKSIASPTLCVRSYQSSGCYWVP